MEKTKKAILPEGSMAIFVILYCEILLAAVSSTETDIAS
jgi:hypothetical protein